MDVEKEPEDTKEEGLDGFLRLKRRLGGSGTRPDDGGMLRTRPPSEIDTSTTPYTYLRQPTTTSDSFGHDHLRIKTARGTNAILTTNCFCSN